MILYIPPGAPHKTVSVWDTLYVLDKAESICFWD